MHYRLMVGDSRKSQNRLNSHPSKLPVVLLPVATSRAGKGMGLRHLDWSMILVKVSALVQVK